VVIAVVALVSFAPVACSPGKAERPASKTSAREVSATEP
jgi:hypothetical protein